MQHDSPAPGVCSLPEPLDDLALIAAVDQEAGDDIGAHLATCAYCAARAALFARLQTQLKARLFRLFCPPSDDLVTYHQNELPTERARAVATHLADCPHCAAELKLLGGMRPLPPDNDGRAPPLRERMLP